MLSNRPYLLRAFYQWIVDSECTPILVINALHPRCNIPQDFVEGGEIVFNISSVAVRDLKISNDTIEFKASFSGVIHLISAPIKAVLAVYAEENGEGIFFDAEEDSSSDEVVPIRELDAISNQQQREFKPAASPAKSKPFLKLVE